jgi:hypothetical protein
MSAIRQPPAYAMPLQSGTVPRLETEPGSRPLVDDKMGWQTGVGPLQHHVPQLPPGHGARVDSQVAALPKNRSWIILIVLMLAALGAGLAIALHGG